MAYTLMKGLLWFVLALALGVTIGWLLRSVVAARQIKRASSTSVDDAEVDRLRTRVSELEAVVVDQAARAEQVDADADSDVSSAPRDTANAEP